MSDPVRKFLRKTIDDRGLEMSALSRAIGRNHAYLQQFLNRGVPLALPEKVRRKLAEELDVDEALLGGLVKALGIVADKDALTIPQHDVRASAGGGTVIEHESVVGQWLLPKAYVRQNISNTSGRLALISVIGDSMEPTLVSGDVIMIDLNDQSIGQPGVFALYDGTTTVVKRLEKVMGSDPPLLRVISDNPRQSTYDVPIDLVNVAGRVVWFGRRM